MNKTSKNLTYFALGTLAILALALVASPAKASAQYQYQYQYQNQNTGFTGYWGGYKYTYPTPSVVYATPYATPYTTPYVAPVYPTPITVISTPVTIVKTNPEPTESYTKLTANAVLGYNSIFPSGLIQWVLFAIVILLIVILVRKMSGAEARYHSTPLKHA